MPVYTPHLACTSYAAWLQEDKSVSTKQLALNRYNCVVASPIPNLVTYATLEIFDVKMVVVKFDMSGNLLLSKTDN